MTSKALADRLRGAIAVMHPSPQRLWSDSDLQEALLPLYGGASLDEIWTGHLQPFIASQRAGLDNVYREHGEAPCLASADAIEFPIILERAENDQLRLERAWPLDSMELLRISDAWGVPVSVASR